jgi:hypothetical protein
MPPGAPAITPTSYSDDPLVPHFTADEVIAFVQAHPGGFRMRAEGEQTIDSVRFALPWQLDDLQLAINYHPSRLICAVTRHGLMAIHGGPAPRPGTVPNREPRMRRTVSYFDAKTGYALGTHSQVIETDAS